MARVVNAHDAADKFVSTADTNCRPGGPTHNEKGNARRQRAHNAILAAGLQLDGVSAEHEEIIRRAARWFVRRKRTRATT
jgi:hypothetical protein